MSHLTEDFPFNQSCDDTLRFDQVVKIDGQVVRRDATLTHLYFCVMRLYGVSRDTQNTITFTQELLGHAFPDGSSQPHG